MHAQVLRVSGGNAPSSARVAVGVTPFLSHGFVSQILPQVHWTRHADGDKILPRCATAGRGYKTSAAPVDKPERCATGGRDRATWDPTAWLRENPRARAGCRGFERRLYIASSGPTCRRAGRVRKQRATHESGNKRSLLRQAIAEFVRPKDETGRHL